MAKANLTPARLRELLHYDPDTGLFTRLVRTSNRIKAGDIAGSKDDAGYVLICVDGCQYFAHRLAWLYVTGEWPPALIDHRDTNKSNNRWSNLRAATKSENGQNRRKARSDNQSSGLLGVSPNHKRWQAKIRIDGKVWCLGTFDFEKAAHRAYLDAKRRLHPFGTL